VTGTPESVPDDSVPPAPPAAPGADEGPA